MLEHCVKLCGRDDWMAPLDELLARTDPGGFLLGAGRRHLEALAPDAGDSLVRALAEQLYCYPIAQRKFPHLHRPGMVYTRQSLAQASGEAVLRWRTASVAEGAEVVDLTGGLGMDSYALSQRARAVAYFERSPELLQIAFHNHQRLAATNIHHSLGDAESWQPEPGRAPDLLFIDPDRRVGGRRAIRLEDSAPDVLAHLPRWRSQAGAVWLKLSPMLDISLALRQLQPRSLQVVSARGQVKELLAQCAEPAASAEVAAVLLDGDGNVVHQFAGSWTSDGAGRHEVMPQSCAVGDWQGWLYDPDPALIKSGLLSAVASRFGLAAIRQQLVWLTGPEQLPAFPGRAYAIEAVVPYQRKRVRRELRSLQIEAVQIHCREFPWTPAQLHEALSLRAGDQFDLFFTRDASGQPQMLITRRAF
jgi:hypothetical protein